MVSFWLADGKYFKTLTPKDGYSMWCVFMARRESWDVLGMVSFGFFLLLAGIIIIITPHPLKEAQSFFTDVFENVQGFPAPSMPHPVLYTAVMRFTLIFGLFSVGILVLRFVLRESANRKAGTVTSVVFWLGVAFLTNLLAAESISWFAFWAGIIMIIGVMVIVGALMRFLSKHA
jgi:hypothetical protein